MIEDLISYNPDTGKCYWKVKRQGSRGIGKEAGTVCIGYCYINISGKMYKRSRLAFYLMIGRWPSEIDHINRDRLDDRWVNLREVSKTQNNINRIRPKVKDRDLPAGVYRHGKRYRAHWYEEKKLKAKSFETAEAAISFRESKMNELYREYLPK